MEIKTPTKEERLAGHMRGIKMTLLPTILGVAAGLLSSPYILSEANSVFSILILAIAIYAQKFIFPPIGIDSSKFGLKDWLYITFMTFAFWFIALTIILSGLHASGGQMPTPLF